MYKNLIAPSFSSKRFIIRMIDSCDAKDLYEICSNKEVTKYLTFEPYQSYRDAKRVIVNMIRSYYQAESINFSIVEKISLKMIGSISLTFHKQENCAEVGYLLNQKFWNQHVMSEVLQSFLDVCFQYYKLDYITARTTHDNLASERVLLKTGFHHRFTKKDELEIHHELKSICYFEMNYMDYLLKKSS